MHHDIVTVHNFVEFIAKTKEFVVVFDVGI